MKHYLKIRITQDADGYLSFNESLFISHNLPSIYQEVSYILGEANGAIINTGIQPDQTTYARIKLKPLAITGDVLFGTKGSGDNND